MPSITIRKLSAETKRRLRIRAAHRGRSMEDEAREILRTSLADGEQDSDLATGLRRRFAPLGGILLQSLPRELVREPPKIAK